MIDKDLSGDINFIQEGQSPEETVREETNLQEEPQVQDISEHEEIPEPEQSSLNESDNSEESIAAPDKTFEEKAIEMGWITKSEHEKTLEEYINKPVTENPLLKRALELEQKGIQVDRTTLLMASEDFDKYDTSNPKVAKDLLKRVKSIENPMLSDDEVNRLIDRDYALATASLDEDDIDYETLLSRQRDAQLDLSIAAKQAKAKLIERQKDLDIPVGGTPQPTQEEKLANERALKEKLASLQSVARDAVSVYEGETVKINENETFTWKLTDEKRSKLESDMVDAINDWRAVLPTTESGEFDLKEIAKMVNLYRDFSSISKGLVDQATAAARLNFINNDVKNVSKPSIRASNSSGGGGKGNYANEKQAAFAQHVGGK